MIVEFLQLLSAVLYHNVHLLIFFFVIFVLLPSVWIRIRSTRYKPYESSLKRDATVVVPVHKEDYGVFERCLKSISNQKPNQFIVSIDSKDEKLIEIARENGAEILKFKKRVGKRRALAEAWLKAKNHIIVQVDSDVILEENCLEEITKPFDDENVVGVASRHKSLQNGSKISYALSALIQENMALNGSALNGNLVVVEGQCSAWRKSFLYQVMHDFLNDYWMGIRSEIGDDRFLSREAIKNGYKTVFQETALVYVPAPKTFDEFLKQQVRWRRSGTKFYMKDVKERVFPTAQYSFKSATYYTSPFVLLAVVMFDLFYFPLPFELWSPWLVPIVIIVGATLITLLRQIIYFGKPLTPKYLLLQGLIGLFVLYPLSIYAALTVKKQHLWLTRDYNNERTKKRKVFWPTSLLIISAYCSFVVLLLSVSIPFALALEYPEY